MTIQSDEQDVGATLRRIMKETNEKLKNLRHNVCYIEYPQLTPPPQEDPIRGGKAMMSAPYHTEMVFHIQDKVELSNQPIGEAKIIFLKERGKITAAKAKDGTVRGTGCNLIVY